MSGAPSASRWLMRTPRPQGCAVRLFCFPHAGGGSITFRGWQKQFREPVEVAAVQPPGRENRLSERPLASLPELRAALADALAPWMETPFAFFGHSFGALVAFELARELRRRRLALPRVLFASGRHAPSHEPESAPLHALPDDELVEEVDRRYGGIPRAILEERELLMLLLPTLRADLTITEGYEYRPEPPLSCRICAFGGEQDTRIGEHELAAWERETAAGFRLRMFPGGHFFIHDSRERVIRAIEAELRRP